MADSLTREQRAMLEGFGRSAAEMLGKKTAPSLKVARGYIAEAGDHTYDVLMPDGAVLEEVPCLVSALGGTVGDEVRVEWVQGRALVTGVVATAANAAITTNLAPIAITPTPNTNLANYNSYTNSSVRFGNLLILQCSIALSTATNWNSTELTLFTLPAGQRPSAERTLQRSALVITNNGANVFVRTIKVRTDGVVRFVNDGSTSNVSRVMLPGVVVRM